MSTARKYEPHYTVDDMQLWEGDWELWFGTAVSMSPSPFGPHERMITKLIGQIERSFEEHRCVHCSAYAGLDWIVQQDTVVRPDVMIVCGDQPSRHLERPPSLTIEVLSPSTAKKDLEAKRDLYESNQIEHYLIINPDDHAVQWFSLGRDGAFVDTTQQITSPRRCTARLKSGCDIDLDFEKLFASLDIPPKI